LFGKEVNTLVKAVTTGGVVAAGPVRANSRGQYVLRALSPGTMYHIVVQSETTTVDNLVTTGTAPLKKDFRCPTRKPSVRRGHRDAERPRRAPHRGRLGRHRDRARVGSRRQRAALPVAGAGRQLPDQRRPPP